MQYAQNTEVPVEKSRAEIERVITRYGATGFMNGWMGDRAVVAFEMKERRIKFFLPLPARSEKRFTHYRPGGGYQEKERKPEQAYASWEQACRQRWRALALAIKAKLEAVETGIASFEEEFMAHIVMPDGLTIGERIIPQLTQILANNRLPPLLPGVGESTVQ